MNEPASHFRPLRWSEKAVRQILAGLTSGYRIRLDFLDGPQVFLGPESSPVVVAVRPPTFWRTLWIFLNPGLRAGESFVRGDWAVTQGDLAALLKITQAPTAGLYARIYRWVSDRRGPIFYLRQRWLPKWGRRNLSEHYNAGNELYRRMLDSTEQYSCAFFSLSKLETLEAAQQAKLTVSIERLHLTERGLRILDVGCGWGALAAEIAKHPGDHEVLGITLSEEQLNGALARRENLPLDVKKRLTYRLEDYDRLMARSSDHFDRIISIGMFEHVGLGRHVHFFKSIERSLCPGGKALVHSIVRPSPGACNEWMRRYVFPGSFLPSVAECIAAVERTNLIVDAIHVHPPTDYRKTIEAWRQRIEEAWPELERADPEKYDARFKRMWTFYLANGTPIFSEDLMNFRIAQVELRKMHRSISLAG
jgi:cyclopropane-fatty-acyl-phospholipid synthase